MLVWPAVLLAVATAVVKDSGERKDKPATFQRFHCLLKLLLSTLKVTCSRWFWGKGERRRSWGGWEKIGGVGEQEPFLPTVLTLPLCSCVSFRGPAYTLSSTIYSTIYLDLGKDLNEVLPVYALFPFPQFYLRQQQICWISLLHYNILIYF